MQIRSGWQDTPRHFSIVGTLSCSTSLVPIPTLPFFPQYTRRNQFRTETKHFLSEDSHGNCCCVVIAVCFPTFEIRFNHRVADCSVSLQSEPCFSVSSSERGRFSAWVLWVNDVPTWALTESLLFYSPKTHSRRPDLGVKAGLTFISYLSFFFFCSLPLSFFVLNSLCVGAFATGVFPHFHISLSLWPNR